MTIRDDIQTSSFNIHNEKLVKYVETYIPIIKLNESYEILDIDDTNAVLYNGDLIGLLTRMKVDINIFYIILRLNNFKGFDEYKGQRQLKIPNSSSIIEFLKLVKVNMNKIG
jgi:hypothetical protein